MRNFFRLMQNASVQPTLASIMRQPELWDTNTLRTTIQGGPHSQISDILLRFGEANLTGLLCHDLPAMRDVFGAKSLALDVMRLVNGDQMGRVMVTRLKPGGRIDAHADEGEYAEFYSRYHLVLQGHPGSIFRCGNESVQMMTGELWWFESHLEHEVLNNSSEDRIHMIIDARVSPGC